VLAEKGGHHIQYTAAAKIWLKQLALDNSFTIDYIQDTHSIDDAFLEQYQIFIQLDFPPYGWTEKAVKSFERFMQRGRGGWIGFHHATLLGEFDGYPMWNWFSDFMGGIRWKNYIATFSTGTVSVEQSRHPVMKGISSQFSIENEEWYTWDKSPRNNVRVLASVDESTYRPNSDVKMGDHPVVWTNEKIPTRNVYIFMGHSPDLFQNQSYTQLFRNSILWMLERK
jgi:type 1 glutamine amidotransferase